MRNRSIAGAILVLGLLAAGPTLASHRVYPRPRPRGIRPQPSPSNPLQAQIQALQRKRQQDEQMASRALSMHNMTVYKQWEHIIAVDTRQIKRLRRQEQAIAQRPGTP